VNYADRRSRVQDELRTQDLDALLVSRLTNIRYLTGFTGTTAFLLMAPEPLLVVDFRYADQVASEVVGVEVRTVQSSRELWPAVKRLLADAGWSRVGLESEQLTLRQYLELTRADGGLEWVPTAGLVERLRRRKDPEEIEAMREAIRITDEAMDELLGIIEPGMTEHRVAGEIERLQRSKGGERSASEIIVASGPRSALPHGIATERVIGANEPVMFDLGTVVRGYLADLTRTIHIGPPHDEFRRIYELVLEAQSSAEQAIRPGLTGREADAVARDIIAEAGFGDRFGHSLGHSIGLDNHETPLLSPFDDTVLEPGMVYTVEPGVYVPGLGGVRIENVVVVTEDGCDVLTRNPKELIEL
jgi:Xaa-Pro aminopeptidase